MLDFLMGYVVGQRTGRTAASMARAGAGPGITVARDIHEINDRIDRMILVVDALWSFLQDDGYSDADLRARIAELDAADGHADGRKTASPRRCPACESMVEPGRASCAFCGEPMEADPLDTV